MVYEDYGAVIISRLCSLVSIPLLFWLLPTYGAIGGSIAVAVAGLGSRSVALASVLLPLAVLEIYMRVKDSRGPARKFAMSSGLVASGLLVLLGTAGIGVALWAPIAKTVHDPRKQIGDTLAITIKSAGIDQATAQYYTLKATEPTRYNFEERQLDKLGYKLLKVKKVKEAIRVFQLNVEAYPKSSNAYDSLAEAYMNDGNKQEAILNCHKSLEIDPKNGHSIKMLNQLNAP